MSEAAPHKSDQIKSRRPKRRLVRHCGLFLLVMVVAGYFGWQYLTSSARVANQAIAQLEEATGFEASIGSAEFSLSGRIDLYDVRLQSRIIPGEAGEIFRDPHVVMHYDRSTLLTGVEVKRIEVSREAILKITEDTDLRRFNFEQDQTPDLKQPEEAYDLPELLVRELTIVKGLTRQGAYLKQGEVRVSLFFKRMRDEAGGYRFTLRELLAGEDQQATELQLNGRLASDLSQLNGELSGFAFVERHANLLPTDVRRWWQEINPVGNAPLISLTYDSENGVQSKLILNDVALTLPQLSRADRRIRMTNVRGEFLFDRDGMKVNHSGEVEDFSYRIEGEIAGFNIDAPFDLSIRVNPTRVPENPPYIVALPENVQQVFGRFLPSGEVRVNARAWRHEAGSMPQYSGTAHLTKASGRYFKFPYPLSDVSGMISFNNEAITIHELVGEHQGGGRVSITGTVAPPDQEYPDILINVVARDLPLDSVLYQSLRPRHQRVLQRILSAPLHQDLIESGMIRSTASTEEAEKALEAIKAQLREISPDQTRLIELLKDEQYQVESHLKLPHFDLGGRVNMKMTIHRPPGDNHDPDTDVKLELVEGNILYAGFPYPVRIAGGRIDITNSLVTLDNVRLRGYDGGEGLMAGSLLLPTPEEPDADTVRLAMQIKGIPINRTLVRAMSRDAEIWFNRFSPDGVLDVVGTYDSVREEAGGSALQIDLDVHQGIVRPGPDAMNFSDVEAKLKLSDASLRVSELTANADDKATITMSGDFDWTDPNDLHASLIMSGKSLSFDPRWVGTVTMLGVETERLIDLLDDAKPVGVYDIGLRWKKTKPDQPDDWQVRLMPKQLAFNLESKRLSFTEMTGAMVVDESEVRLEDIVLKLDAGELKLNGQVRQAGQADVKLDFEGKFKQITDDLRSALPEDVQSVIQQLNIVGEVENIKGTIMHRPNETQGPVTDVQTTIQVRQGAFVPGIEINGFDGKVQLSIQAFTDQRPTRIQIALDAEQATTFDRRVTDLRARVMSDDKGENLLVPEITGRVAGGQISGKGWIGKTDGRYQLELNLTGANLREAVSPGEEVKEDAFRGDLAGRLAIEGDRTKPNAIRARGDLLISNATMYDLPLSMGFLQMTHLSLPTTRSFSRGRISYLLRGSEMTFSTLEIASDDVVLSGGGTLNIDSKKLDLRLTSANPRGGGLGPLGELIDGIRDQFVTIQVTGTLDNPKTQIRPLSIITEGIDDVLGNE